MLPRRLWSPLPDRQHWQDIKARMLCAGDVVATGQLGGVDSIVVLGDQVLIEGWDGREHIFALEDIVVALVG